MVKLWDDREMKLVSELSGEFTHTSGHSNRIFCTKFSPFSQSTVISGGWDNNIFMYDMRKRSPIAFLHGPHTVGDSIEFIDEDTLLTGSFTTSHGLQTWDLRKMEVI